MELSSGLRSRRKKTREMSEPCVGLGGKIVCGTFIRPCLEWETSLFFWFVRHAANSCDFPFWFLFEKVFLKWGVCHRTLGSTWVLPSHVLKPKF